MLYCIFLLLPKVKYARELWQLGKMVKKFLRLSQSPEPVNCIFSEHEYAFYMAIFYAICMPTAASL